MCAVAGMLMASCVDTNVLPDDTIVAEDYWQTREDVSMMVAGAYKAMCSSDVIQRLIVWGSARSDELNPTTSITINNTTSNDLEELNTGNMDYQNTYATWAGLYTVINRCNQVLANAEQVMALDPSYTESTYLTDRSQMLALRSLAYFYLVRAFRDIPYSDTAYINSSQNMYLEQESPGAVLGYCISALEEALQNPLSATGYSDWRKCGLMTRDGINTLLADIYLWRASMTGSASDYQMCVDYCQDVIDSKREAYYNNMFAQNEQEVDYPLIDGNQAYYSIFTSGNSQESIFELQMTGGSTVGYNTGLAVMYWNYASSTSAGYLEPATNVFGAVSGSSNDATMVSDTRAYYSDNDYRYWEGCFDVVASGSTAPASLCVAKMMYYSNYTTGEPSSHAVSRSAGLNRSTNTYSAFEQNWIVYRITDVMLMQAEALVQLASDDNDSKLQQAFNLVQAVNTRAMGTDKSDSLVWSDFSAVGKTTMEQLVMAERLRELCFEGKRWFDLMRYNYRHVDGVDINQTMYEILDGQTVSSYPVSNYADMLTLMSRKYTSNGAKVRAKLSKEPMLYFPISEDEMNANPNLHQNPAYDSGSLYQRN